MPDEAGGSGAGTLELRFPASAWEVRAALQEMLRRLPLAGFEAELPGALEIVMAEVMNNVVEHAYRGTAGMIELQVRVEPGGLRCWVTDYGPPFEAATRREGELPQPGLDGLPEGGFGWFLITALAREIAYQREDGANRLSFLLAAKAAVPLPEA